MIVMEGEIDLQTNATENQLSNDKNFCNYVTVQFLKPEIEATNITREVYLTEHIKWG
jgi:hypothetical protein